MLLGQTFHAIPGNRQNGAVLHGYHVVRTHDTEQCRPVDWWTGVDTYNWTGMDALVNLHCVQNGAKLLATFTGCPTWAAARPSESGPYGNGSRSEPSDRSVGGAWDRAIRAYLTRYGQYLYGVEGWNEADYGTAWGGASCAFYTGTAAIQADLQRLLFNAARAIVPTAKVYSTGFAYCLNAGQMGSKLSITTTDGQAYLNFVDVIGIHPYDYGPSGQTPFGDLPACVSSVKTLAPAKLWAITEWGIGDYNITGAISAYNAKTSAQKGQFQYDTLMAGNTSALELFVLYAYDDESLVNTVMNLPQGTPPTYNSTVAGYINTAYTALGGAGVYVPSAPSGLTATAASGQVALSWTDNSSNETGFSVERAVGAGSFSQVQTVGANGTSWTDTAVTAGTTYSYRVTATNAAGSSAYSNTATVTVSSSLPAAPSGLVAIVQSTQVSLTWVDNATTETGFYVERAVGAGAFAQVASLAANTTSWADTAVSSSTSYSYRVRACNAGGNSSYSSTATVTTSSSTTGTGTPSGATIVGTVQQIIDEARLTLNDPAKVRFPDTELLQYYNDGSAAVVHRRPDLFVGQWGALPADQQLTDTIPFPSTFRAPLAAYIVFRAESKDDELVDGGRASQFMNLAAQGVMAA